MHARFPKNVLAKKIIDQDGDGGAPMLLQDLALGMEGPISRPALSSIPAPSSCNIVGQASALGQDPDEVMCCQYEADPGVACKSYRGQPACLLHLYSHWNKCMQCH